MLYCQDLSTGKELMSPIPSTSGDVVWANDNATLFYIIKVRKCMKRVLQVYCRGTGNKWWHRQNNGL
jgi:protease II